ncbi:unnamed protein product [Chironomus riparius]|uniref:Peptidase S1 domain-containing protein n=1 Tax=Chironomus riparius TaxID=315576 RepID=A0A9N9S1T8_9DIPT|nr:unnamed protein product [Chironomus riparius]
MWKIFCCIFILSSSKISCLQDLSEFALEDHTVDINAEDEIISECGAISEPTGLIQGGNYSQRNEFPWMAIISVESHRIKSHKGSGSLISKRHIIAKARAVSTLESTRLWKPVDPKNVEIYLGTKKFADLSAEGSLKVGALKIQSYPNARKVSISFSIFNFAVITLDQDISFNDFIRPICLWNFDADFEKEIIGKTTYAVGYGVDETGAISLKRKHASTTITDDATCQYEYNTELEQGSESKFFCILGTDNNNNGPCHYDSQLYIKVMSTWYLKGIMCSARMYFGFKICAVSYPILVEDISPYVEWINKEIK